MNRLKVGAALAVLLMVSSAPHAFADDPPPKETQAPWYQRWFGRTKKEPPKVEQVKPKTSPGTEAAIVRAKAEAELNRRREVCDQIRQIAFETSNKELQDKADRLDREAWDAYQRAVAHLPVGRMMPGNDEKLLDQKLAPAPATTAASAARLAPKLSFEQPSQASAAPIREVKP
jgi:hypothetical protein